MSGFNKKIIYDHWGNIWSPGQGSRKNTVSANTLSQQSKNTEHKPQPPQIPQPQPPQPNSSDNKNSYQEKIENFQELLLTLNPEKYTHYSQDCSLFQAKKIKNETLKKEIEKQEIKLKEINNELKRLESDIKAQIYHNSVLENKLKLIPQNGGAGLLKQNSDWEEEKKRLMEEEKKMSELNTLIKQWEETCLTIKKKEEIIKKQNDYFNELIKQFRKMNTKIKGLDNIKDWVIYNPIVPELIMNNEEYNNDENKRKLLLNQIENYIKNIKNKKPTAFGINIHKKKPKSRRKLSHEKKQGETKKSKKKGNVSEKKSTKKKRRGGKRARTRGRSRA